MNRTLSLPNHQRLSLSAFILTCCCAYTALAEPVRDNFSDGSITDGTPIAWNPRNSAIVFEDGLRLTNSDGDAAIMETEVSNSTGWSMRVRAKQQEGDVTGLGTISSPVTWAVLNPNGRLNVGEGSGEVVLASVQTGVNPREDFILQMDTFDNELRAWAWQVGADPESAEPMVTASFDTLPNANAAFWVRDFSGENDGLGQSTFRWFEFSDEHIPIPVAAVPEPSGLAILIIGLSLMASRSTTVRNRSARNWRRAESSTCM